MLPVFYHSYIQTVQKHVRDRLQRTSGKWRGGGFEILDVPRRGRGLVDYFYSDTSSVKGWFVKIKTFEKT